MTLMCEYTTQQWHLMKTTDPQHMTDTRLHQHLLHHLGSVQHNAFASKRFVTDRLNWLFNRKAAGLFN